jgi:LysR family transcriptional regulator, regulator for bpeEF and oprC
MDKLRALEYFVAAAEAGSLSGAARHFEVSIPAVAKMVTALEKRLGTQLFDRGVHGLALTADGERYLESCRPLLEELAAVDEAMGSAAERPRGEVVVGGPAFALQNCLGPFLPRFHQRYPDIDLDFRIANHVGEGDRGPIDLFILFGWHDTPDLVQRPLAQARYVVLASPEYWRQHGRVEHPRDLARRQCFAFRNPRGMLLDLWEFERGKEKESIQVRGWLASGHRNLLIDTALAGEGIIRGSDLITLGLLKAGRLVSVLDDWNGLHPPPISLAYRSKHARVPRIRAVIDFLADCFRKLEAERSEGRLPMGQRPDYYERRYNRVSSSLR